MSVSLTRFSWWYWSNGKEKEPVISSDSMKLSSSTKKKDSKLSSSSSSSSKKLKKKWQSREERKIVMDKEYDLVLVASDEESSYDSDWSIGWMEPHAPDFLQSDDEDDDHDVADNSFAVLVPCYRNNSKTFKTEEQVQPSNNHFLNVLTNGFPAEGNKYMEQWLASLQDF